MALAHTEARSLSHNYVGTEHMLLGILSRGDSVAHALEGLGIDHANARAAVVDYVGPGPLCAPDPAALGTIGIDLDEVRRRVEDAFGPGALERTRAARAQRSVTITRSKRRPWTRRTSRCEMRYAPSGYPMTPRVAKVLGLARREARRLGRVHAAPADLVLGLLREGEGLAALVLARAGIDFDEARRAIEISAKTTL
jgi:ATP-dependent Clp protease ATP-binding subunit ClpA